MGKQRDSMEIGYTFRRLTFQNYQLQISKQKVLFASQNEDWKMNFNWIWENYFKTIIISANTVRAAKRNGRRAICIWKLNSAHINTTLSWISSMIFHISIQTPSGTQFRAFFKWLMCAQSMVISYMYIRIYPKLYTSFAWMHPHKKLFIVCLLPRATQTLHSKILFRVYNGKLIWNLK